MNSAMESKAGGRSWASRLRSGIGVLAALLWATGALGGTVNVIHDFTGTDGDLADSVLIEYNGKLYGMTSDGGASDRGVVFSINPDGSEYTLLHEFAGGVDDGRAPRYGALVEIAGRLYGMTSGGGNDSAGVIFAIDADGTDFTLLHEFSGTDGSTPYGQLCLYGGKLYGMTSSGGTGTKGVVFRINPNGTSFELLHEFVGGVDDGDFPYSTTLTPVGARIFGMTGFGGNANVGVVFSMNPDGSDFTLMHEFADGPDDGSMPQCSLILYDGIVYGATSTGGSSGAGVLFRLPPLQPLEIIHHFAGGADDGKNPRGSLFGRNGRIFGTTQQGGDTDDGVIYSINPNGSGFFLHHEFADTPDGSMPVNGLMESGQRMYGVTYKGGAGGFGCIYTYYDFTVTFQTDGTPGAALSGETVQTLQFGADCTAVEALPVAGYAFIGWSGGYVGTENPLTLTNVTGNLTVTANYAQLVPLTMAVVPPGTGTTEPAVGGHLVPLGEPVEITATAGTGYHFDRWLVTVGAATFADPFSAATEVTVTVIGGATVAARFEINEYRVEFETDGTSGAALTGELVQTIVHGSACTPVTVLIPENLDFIGWSGGYVGTDNPLTLANVTAAMTVTANFGRYLAYGSTFTFDAADVAGLPTPDLFLVKPKVYGTYFDPVKDPAREKEKKGTAKVLTKVDGDLGTATLSVEWKKKVKLYDVAAYKTALKAGTSADTWLADTDNQAPLALDLRASSKELDEESVYAAQLMPPEITGVVDNGDGTLTVAGRHFGTKKPKVWREYVDGGVVKTQKYKVLSPEDPDLVDAAGKLACMDAATDVSQVVVEIPTKDPGTLNGILVIENGVGMAAVNLDR
jgi:uncharacterized repeat protein (TIGR03803 family)